MPLRESALRLAGSADSLCDGIRDFFGAPPFARRLPVLLSDTSPWLNGYSSPAPSDRIVIYLAPGKADDSLASIPDELAYVFIHELTHAVTLSLRSPFWSFMSGIFGDAVEPAAAIAPYMLVEGTAVWAESRTDEILASARLRSPSGGRGGFAAAGNSAFPAAGRLDDPAFLEPARFDLAAGREREMWEVSGVADFPGSGQMPYLYGALFARFMTETYGTGSLGLLWEKCSRGNVFAGFDGSPASGGALDGLAGISSADVWSDFMAWLDRECAAEAGEPTARIAGTGRRPGAFTVSEGVLYFVDLEKEGIYALDLASGGAADAGIDQGGAAGGAAARMADAAADAADEGPARRLCGADPWIERLEPAPEGRGIIVDWVRRDAGGSPVPARYRLDPASGKLEPAGDIEADPLAMPLGLIEDPAFEPAFPDPVPGSRPWAYRLVRAGSRALLARKKPGEAMEVLYCPLDCIRSFSVEERTDPPRIAIAAVPAKGLSRLAVLTESASGPELLLQKKSPQGGVHSPVLAGNKAVYLAFGADGERSLRVLDTVPEVLREDFEALPAEWMSLEDCVLRLKPDRSPSPIPLVPTAPDAQDRHPESEELAPALFPAAFRTLRYPYADMESVGVIAEGADLTERLFWAASAGWNHRLGLPEASAVLGLSAGRANLSFAMYDRAIDSGTGTGPIRASGAILGLDIEWPLLPRFRRFILSMETGLAAYSPSYSLQEYFSPAYGTPGISGRVSARYSGMRKSLFAPFNEKGASVEARADMEGVPAKGAAVSFSGTAKASIARPGLSLELSGAWTPSPLLRFLPRGREFGSGIGLPVSGLSPGYPLFGEYGAMDGGSPWYASAELKAMLCHIEGSAFGALRLPYLPGAVLRRIVFHGIARAACLDQGGSIRVPASLALRGEADISILAGVAAEGSLLLSAEARLALDPSLAGGRAFSFIFGLEAGF